MCPALGWAGGTPCLTRANEDENNQASSDAGLGPVLTDTQTRLKTAFSARWGKAQRG